MLINSFLCAAYLKKFVISTMRQFIFLLLILSLNQGYCRALLSDLDFSEGKWEMVGVTLHNFKLVPEQEEIGTFVCTDMTVLKAFQANWDFDYQFEDFCDYHYALKFYKNGELIRTFRVNLICNYISLGGLSLDLFKYKSTFKKVNWSRISFETSEGIKNAVSRLEKAKGIWLYHDIKPFAYEGYFVIGVNNMPWGIDRDSLQEVVRATLKEYTGRTDFYLQQNFYFIDKGIQSLRYQVFCEEEFFTSYKGPGTMANWRRHLDEADRLQIIVVGMTRKMYADMMGY